MISAGIDIHDSIAAIASPAGGAARGVVRISGPDPSSCLKACFQASDGSDLSTLRQPTAVDGTLRLPRLASLLACTVYLWPTERSYTRQPVVEIHTLGSPPLMQLVLRTVLAAGARQAGPGEFTLRAFLAGRLDLTQAEAVLGAIDARHERDFSAALRQLAGGLSGPLNQIRNELLDLLAHLEAGLDFVEEDIEFISSAELDAQLAAAAETVDHLRQQLGSRTETHDAPRAVLYGSPNVGKSRLFNALAGGGKALVSPVAGTTRDYLTAEVELEGLPCRLIDTAGCDAPAAAISIDAAAQQLGQEQAAGGHLRLLCLDSTRPLNDWERKELADTSGVPPLLVMTKADQPRGGGAMPPAAIETSAISGVGLDELRRRMRQRLQESVGEGSGVAATAARCGESLRLAADCLVLARQNASTGGGHELVAADIRTALDELGKVVGAVYTDDVLDRIFSRFCIGK